MELVGLAGVEAGEEFAFEVALPEEPALKRYLDLSDLHALESTFIDNRHAFEFFSL